MSTSNFRVGIYGITLAAFAMILMLVRLRVSRLPWRETFSHYRSKCVDFSGFSAPYGLIKRR